MNNSQRLLLGIFLLSNLMSVDAAVDRATLDLIGDQVTRMDTIFGDRFPEYTINGEWTFREQPNWLSGFIGGELWYLYEMTGEPDFMQRALRHADRMTDYATIDYTHDMGFIFLPTCVKAYQVTGDPKYRDAAIRAAEMLVKRFNPKGQFIRAWGKLDSSDRAGQMIIDTMMNLELLFWVAEETGQHEWYDIAYRHALTCMRESIRPDGSSYHVIEFDPESGQLIKKYTHQGYSDESTWARGQAWGIYGFATAYRYTKDERFLQCARLMADYFWAHLPENRIPYWDLTLSGENVIRDASAAAIAAAGLFRLADLEETRADEIKYIRLADEITTRLTGQYLFSHSSRGNEQGLLLHTVYHYHKEWGVDESYPAGDFYALEAIATQWSRQRQRMLIQDQAIRQKYNLNSDWYYLEEAIPDAEHLFLATRPWRKIDLPHTWNAFDAIDNVPGYRRDAGWYRKDLFVPKLNHDQRIVLYFEGVNITSEVFVNGQKAGGHIGGYIGFESDITPFIKQGETNLVLVRADNSYNPEVAPSQKSDFFIYGGIARDVWLKVLPPKYIGRIKISTSAVSKKTAETNLLIQLRNYSEAKTSLVLEAEVMDEDGKIMLTSKKKVEMSEKDETITMSMPKLKNPQLWSPDLPALYTVNVSLKDGSEQIDRITERFGYRWFEFKEHGPFYLNGERLLLRGTHRHEEHAGLGNALPNAQHRKDMQMIKEMGANFVRLVHYPQDPEVYRACDELGLLVWDELPWCRGGMGFGEWKVNTRRMLTDMIDQNYNHPAIIIWSLGNELYWLPDFEGGGNVDSLRSFLSELNVCAHNLDPSRVTATRKFYEGADIVDVFSPSIWAGWYSGVYKNYETAITKSHNEYARFFHAEYGGSSHLGRHVENPITGDGIINPEGWEEDVNQVQVKNISQYGDWSENYIVDLFDWHLHIAEQMDWFTGNAQWAFKDFGTPLRPENAIPYINQKGLVDRAGNPKDAYYVFKSYWTTSPKFCYIESHSWTERCGPKGAAREVCVYSNCTEVELLLNGESQGKHSWDVTLSPACGLAWDVAFREGPNELTAVGYDMGEKTCQDSLVINYSTEKSRKPDRIELLARPLPNGRLLIEALVVDVNGKRCLDYNKRIYFSSDGSGSLLINYGSYTGSQSIEAANGRAAVEFQPVPGEKAVIEVRNQDFKGSYLTIEN